MNAWDACVRSGSWTGPNLVVNESPRSRRFTQMADGNSYASSDSDSGTEELDSVAAVSVTQLTARTPPASAKLAARPKWLPPTIQLNLSSGNPVFGLRMQLYCRTGHHIAIFEDKKVRGLDIDQHPNAILEFSSVCIGEVRMRSVTNNLYLAMNKKGRLYGEVDENDLNTVFLEYMFGNYNTYLSKNWAHRGWYVAIKKSGKMKPGEQTRWGQKSTQFLPRRVK